MVWAEIICRCASIDRKLRPMIEVSPGMSFILFTIASFDIMKQHFFPIPKTCISYDYWTKTLLICFLIFIKLSSSENNFYQKRNRWLIFSSFERNDSSSMKHRFHISRRSFIKCCWSNFSTGVQKLVFIREKDSEKKQNIDFFMIGFR